MIRLHDTDGGVVLVDPDRIYLVMPTAPSGSVLMLNLLSTVGSVHVRETADEVRDAILTWLRFRAGSMGGV